MPNLGPRVCVLYVRGLVCHPSARSASVRIWAAADAVTVCARYFVRRPLRDCHFGSDLILLVCSLFR